MFQGGSLVILKTRKMKGVIRLKKRMATTKERLLDFRKLLADFSCSLEVVKQGGKRGWGLQRGPQISRVGQGESR